MPQPACRCVCGTRPRAAGDTSWLFYTSRTTGRPKGVMTSARNPPTRAMGYSIDVDAIDPADAIVHAAPMSPGGGLNAILPPMAGACDVVPASGGVDAAALFGVARTHGPGPTSAASTILNRTVDHVLAHGLTSSDCAPALETIVYGAAPMHPAGIRQAVIAGASYPRHAVRLASVGVAWTPVQVRIAAPAMRASALPHATACAAGRQA